MKTATISCSWHITKVSGPLAWSCVLEGSHVTLGYCAFDTLFLYYMYILMQAGSPLQHAPWATVQTWMRIASYPDLSAHTHTFMHDYFLSHRKAGRSGRFGDVMVMSRMWTILRFLAVSSTKRGIESKQKLEQGLVGSFSWPSESSQRVPGSLAPSEGSPHKKRWVCQCLKLTKDRSLPFQGFERRLALFGA